MLDIELKEQVRTIFAGLSSSFLFDVYVSDHHESRDELIGLLEDTASCSDRIEVRINQGPDLLFNLLKDGRESGITFRMVPNGHEFSTLLLAVLNCDGKGKSIPDDFTKERVKALGEIHLETYVSLTCTNCPDVAQALNLMALINPKIRNEVVDGAIYQERAEQLKIQAVPAVVVNGELIHSGRSSFGELLDKLEVRFGRNTDAIGYSGKKKSEQKKYDVLVVGGGPAGVSAAIYSARKGLKVAILADRIGGQIRETSGIENLISVLQTSGVRLASDLKRHLLEYPVDIIENRTVEKAELSGNDKLLFVRGGEIYSAPALIIATGASWRRLQIEGESQYIGKGVAFCPHCDGPFYKGKRTAVIGGGNSGVEAAIDLAGICSQVTVFEFLEELKADQLLQKKLKDLPNVKICTNAQATGLLGDNKKITGIRIKDRQSGTEQTVNLDGVFVQIGLTANSSPFAGLVPTNRNGEIEIDSHCRTTIPGIYAAGDVSTVPYKQIVIAMGEGAKAALSAFEDRMREDSSSPTCGPVN